MTTKEQLHQMRDQIMGIAKENGIISVSIFGSTVRGEDGPDSDVDFLVELDEGRSLFDMIRFKQAMEELFGKKVDVVTKNAVHWTMKEHVLNEARPI